MWHVSSLVVISLLFLSVPSWADQHERRLRNCLSGITAIFPDDSEFRLASQAFNLRFEFKPAAVVYPGSSDDISRIIKTGSELDLQVVARSGGHSYIANGCGGQNDVLVIDMKNFTEISINLESHIAKIGTGSKLGDIAVALNMEGRAIPHGVCPHVGIGGHSGYGGRGYTSRMWGLTLDTVHAIDLVLANGTKARASKDLHADLFWALRGSVGSFGIATSVEFRTFAAPPSATVFEYLWDLDVAEGAKAFGAFQGFVQTEISPEFSADVLLTQSIVEGRITFGLTGGWYGAAHRLNSTLLPFMSRMPLPFKTTLTVGNYIDSVSYLGGGNLDVTSGGSDTFYVKSLMTPEDSPMSAQAITALVSYLAHEGFTSVTHWFVQVELYGGTNSVTNAIDVDHTSFPHRNSLFTIQFYARSANGSPPYPEAGFGFLDGMLERIISNSPPDWKHGAYINYVDDRMHDWKKRYYGPHYARLQKLKRHYDPEGLFSFPTAIEL